MVSGLLDLKISHKLHETYTKHSNRFHCNIIISTIIIVLIIIIIVNTKYEYESVALSQTCDPFHCRARDYAV